MLQTYVIWYKYLLFQYLNTNNLINPMYSEKNKLTYRSFKNKINRFNKNIKKYIMKYS